MILSLFIAIEWVQIQPYFSELEDFVPKLLSVKVTDSLQSPYIFLESPIQHFMKGPCG